LIALKQRVQLLQFDNPNEGINHSLNELENLTEQTVENLRRMTRNLRPIYLEDLGLVPALQMLSNEVEKQNAIAVQFNRKGIERRLPPAIELALYRIAQEALNNVVQHSLASQTVLTLAFSQEDVCLDIIDNGKGFQVPPSPADFATEGHFGLLGLHERAELIGAVLSVKSSNHQGTHVHISLPLKKISNFDVDKELEIR
jgi:two-component system, NarL family, sensor histidine kinase UhpB